MTLVVVFERGRAAHRSWPLEPAIDTTVAGALVGTTKALVAVWAAGQPEADSRDCPSPRGQVTESPLCFISRSISSSVIGRWIKAVQACITIPTPHAPMTQAGQK
jgi:hypothetical protein